MDKRAVEDKPLVLINRDSNEYFPNSLDYCYLKSLYLTNNKINRVVRKIVLKLNFSFIEKHIFRDWYKLLKKVKTVILFDTGNAPYICDFIKKTNPSVRLILWYWNPISCTVGIDKFKDKDIEIWTFDSKDKNTYNIKENTQFFIEENVKNLTSINGKDVFYVGVDKNRAQSLSELASIFDKENITYNYNLVKYKDSSNNNGIEYKNRMVYKDVLSNINASKAVLDLVSEKQTGLTLRPLEALFLKKKLITNMVDIVDYDIYNKNNIFILGKDDLTKLKEFISSSYDETNYKKFTKKYCFRNWIKRFDS